MQTEYRNYLRKMTLLLILFVLTLIFMAQHLHAAPKSIHPVSQEFYSMLNKQEASGRMNPPDGDGGKAIGPFQIWHSYWKDAVEYDPSIGGTYQHCRDWTYAKKVVCAYLNRYCRTAVVNNNLEIMARVHNGGPNGMKKSSTLIYWNQFKQRHR